MTHACVAALDAAPAHELRHSAARVLAAAGVPLEEVVYVLGHTSTRVTSSVYRHRTTPDAEAAVKTTDRPARPAGTRVGLEVQRPSLARLLARPAVAPVIVEAETIDELRANASASDVDRTREQRDAVSGPHRRPPARPGEARTARLDGQEAIVDLALCRAGHCSAAGTPELSGPVGVAGSRSDAHVAGGAAGSGVQRSAAPAIVTVSRR